MENAKEKLVLELAALGGDKYSEDDYNEKEYIDNRLVSEGMKVYENYVLVDSYLFEIDRQKLKIKDSLGKRTLNEKIQIIVEKEIVGNYEEAKVKIKVIYNTGEIKNIKLGGEEISYSNTEEGIYEGSKEITLNGIYNIIAIDEKEMYNLEI